MSKPMDVSPSRPDCALLTRSSKKSSFISPPRVWPAGRGSVLHEPCTARSRRAPPWQAARRCDEQQGGAGGIAKCRCLCFRAAAACTPPSRGQPRLDFEVWQDDRLARPGRAGWGRLNGAKRAHSSHTWPIGLAQAANPRAASLPTEPGGDSARLLEAQRLSQRPAGATDLSKGLGLGGRVRGAPR